MFRYLISISYHHSSKAGNILRDRKSEQITAEQHQMIRHEGLHRKSHAHPQAKLI